MVIINGPQSGSHYPSSAWSLIQYVYNLIFSASMRHIKVFINFPAVLFCYSYKYVEFLSTSHSPNTANDNLSNKAYLCLGLLANLADILRKVDAIFIILDIFIPCLPCEMISH